MARRSSTRALNLSDGEIERAGRLLTEFLRGLEKSLPTRPVLPPLDRAVLSQILGEGFPETGIGVDGLFDEIVEKVVPNSTMIAHPRFLAYVQGPPNGIAPFAEAIASALNQNCNIWQLSPAASIIEQRVISWMAELFGYPASAGGIMTSGGSIATLVALVTALHDRGKLDFRKTGLQSSTAPRILYTSAESHRSVEKDAVILGLGLDNVRKIPVDGAFRMRVDLLEDALRADRRAGRVPFCVVATAGTVNTGAIDPIEELASFCSNEELWLHVDGAYGAFFILSERMRDALFACGRADSVTLDPHKLLFAPIEAGCLIVRERDKLKSTFGFSASYIPQGQDTLMTDFMDYGPQLSRGFKAFKVWCALRAFGTSAFEAAAERVLDIARYLGEKIEADPSLELLAPVALSAVCFRLRGADDAGNRRILADLVEEGTALLGPVSINGRFGMRACVTNFRTTREDVDLILRRLTQIQRFR